MRLFFQAAISAAIILSAAHIHADTNAVPAFRDPDLALEQRLTNLVSLLTTEEKVSLLDMESPGVPRLGIKAFFWWSEAGHGIARAGRATMFPQAIAMAASWNDDLMKQVASVIGDEARAKHNQKPVGRYRGLTLWSPCINLVRDPRWGRIQECYGEDPLLTARMGMAYVRGVQGDHPKYIKAVATPKHFIANNQEHGRHGTSFDIMERDLREYYLPAFRACLVEAGAQSIMSAHNGINGTPCTANRWLLTEVLRDEWDFDGAVVTDWGATGNLVTRHHLLTNEVEAAATSLNAGVDVLCGFDPWTNRTSQAVAKGLVSTQRLDTAVTRGLRVRFRLGEFDPPAMVPFNQYGPEMIGSEGHVALALELARQSIVLLKNEPVVGRADPTPLLPLNAARLDSIAVIGPHAAIMYLGIYSGRPASPPISPVAGMVNRLGPRTVLRSTTWQTKRNRRRDKKREKKKVEPDATPRNQIEEAVAAAAISDVAIVCVGLNGSIESEGKDRAKMDLPREDQELIERVLAVNPATVVVLFNGGPVTIPWIKEHVPAVVEAWHAGEQGGHAVADVLLGDYNPAGRLPMTFYTSTDQLPPITDYPLAAGRTYLYLKEDPLFPFGHGLSYTSFEYGDLRATPATVPTNGQIEVEVSVTNTGMRDGDEVVQVYVRDIEADVTVPLKQLRDYRRVSIPRAQSVQVKFTLDVSTLALWDVDSQRYQVPPGEFEIMVGASSADIRSRARVTVE